MPLWAAFFLQLWIQDGTQLRPATAWTCGEGLAYALQDADSLLRAFALQETVTFVQHTLPTVEVWQTSPVRLVAPDTLGWAYALYLLLEEKQGFAFVHPRLVVRTPHLRRWQRLVAQPRFRWRGFHLHTQHPIELTEPLHDPDFPNGEQIVQEYLTWLARNRQNYFEFCLLRTVDLRRWIPYFERIVRYAKTRGIAVGLDLSLRMQQQKAFQLLPRYSLQSKRQRLRSRLRQLAATGISHLNVELTTAEFVGKEWGPWIDSLLAYAHELGLTVLSRQHVVPPEAYAAGTFSPLQLPPSLTLCVHSVMCYSLQDSLAPVYRCRNFSHLYQTLQTEKNRRPVWYYPETAYWVTFDNSVPVWLLSYLRSRAEDIHLVEGLAEGHLTFSSGWEVGYWLFDWSVARWSWRYQYDTTEAPLHPAEGFVRLFGGDTTHWARLIRFQDSLLVGRNLLSYLTPTTPIDEISWQRLPAFQPRLPLPPKKLYRHPTRYTAQFSQVLAGWAQALQNWPTWPAPAPADSTRAALAQELSLAWEITRLRVLFRYHWLQGLLSPRESPREATHLDTLSYLLTQAQTLVRRFPLRYPWVTAKRLCQSGCRPGRHPHPSYRFGYLYPAYTLHFWRRELNQLAYGRWGPFYQNLWDIPRIIGLW